MLNSVGGSQRHLDLESIFRPYTDKGISLNPANDGDEVRLPAADSVDVDGCRADAKKSAVSNVKSMAKTVRSTVAQHAALDSIVDGIHNQVDLRRVFFNFIDGVALDACTLAKAPAALAKDGLDAVRWTAQAGVEALAGHGSIEARPVPHAGTPPAVDQVDLRTKETGRSGYFQYALKDGYIWTKYDPVLPDKPFTFDMGEPINSEQAKAMLGDARGPYDYSYNAENNSITCSPKANAGTVGYKMVNGRLEEAPLQEATQWHLHDRFGGPNLPAGEKVVQIQVAGDFVEALTNKNTMYRYDPTKADCRWKAEVGCPSLGHVHLPEGIRDWTLGEAVTVKPKRNCLKSMNPYTDIVGHYTDARGRKGDFNFVATTGVLTANGREIRYRDTGLAADFTRGFLTPQKGEFEADVLASAGSTWMVCGTDSEGKPGLYTRMYDYEINGACPGQRYTYDDTLEFDPQQNHSFADNVPFMPLPGWQKVEFPTLSGEAALTNHIDVLPRGQGNDARELRIAGKNEAGEVGYYSKMMADSDWQFTVTGGELTGKPVNVGVVDPQRVSRGPVTLDYPQAKWGDDLKHAPIKNIALNGFHQFQTPDQPSEVVFTLNSGKEIKVALHTVDGYSFYNMRKEDVDKLGEGAGVPKVLTGTWVIPDEIKNSSDPEVKAFTQQYLTLLDRKENQLMLIADRDGVRMTSSWYHRDSDYRFDWTKNPHYDITFSRDAQGETYYEKKVASAGLEPKGSMEKATLRDLIMRNESMRDGLASEMKRRKFEHKLLWIRAQATELAMRGIGLGICALNLSENVKHGAAASQLMPPLMDAHEKSHFSSAFKTPAGYARAVEALEQNIAEAKEMLKGAD